jgi:signal transduction histidine kinase
MNIQAKVSVTFTLLMIFGVTAISSYAILFIRNYLLDSGVATMERHAEWMALSVRELPEDDEFRGKVGALALAAGYDVGLYDADSTLFFVYGTGAYDAEERVNVMRDVVGSRNQAIRLELSLPRETLYEPVKTIRWIIYTGMFISIGIILLVSRRVATSLSKPIRALDEAASRIADGDVMLQVRLDRPDEFGTLATSINRMAERLRADLAQLEATSERQSRFYADIAHEIRNPLHNLLAAVDMARLESLPAEERNHYLSNAANQAERLSLLFNDLMTLQRSDADPNFVTKADVDMDGILRKVGAVYADAATAKGLRLDIPETGLQVHADAGKLEQVFDNLISNAIKYTAAGRVWVEVDEAETGVAIRVCDTGHGIPAEHLPHVFDRFYRTDKARSRDSGGSGLGLAVVKSIIDAHGGEVRITSDVGTGTVAHIRLRT